MKKALLLGWLLCGWLGGAWGQSVSPQDELEIRNLLEQAVRALESEDLPAALATLDPASPFRPQAEQLGKALFEQHDLRYELEDVQPGRTTPDGVEVRATLTARRTGGAAFRDVRTTVFGLLRKTANGYRLYTGRVEKREYL
jgi:hypothetical protein